MAGVMNLSPRTWERRTLLALLIIVGCAWLTIGLTEAVAHGSTAKIDNWILESLRRQSDLAEMRGPSWLPETVRDVTALGSAFELAGLTFGVAGFLALAGRRDTALFVLLACSTGTIASLLFKMVMDRPRPEIVPHLARVTSSSFPSSHSMLSAVVYLTLGSVVMSVVEKTSLKIYVMSLAIALTLLVGLSRLLLGVHYPSDVLAGWSLGVVWAEGCWLIERTRRSRSKQPLTAIMEEDD
jgi:undecaprenyl-diphosphatase